LIAGNWKMNTSVEEAITLAGSIIDQVRLFDTVDTVFCPPFISLRSLKDTVAGTGVELGAQNMYFREKGAFTGEISPLMLKGLCKYVILGHSERRQFFHETDSLINEKVKAAISSGLIPIFCIGESLAENEAGKTEEILDVQVRDGLKDVAANPHLVVAYEPVWAIGTGRAATGVQAAKTIGFIRQKIAAGWGQDAADSLRILYGGSVTGANIAEFIKEPQIDGALVGGASLKAGEFVDIVRQTAALKK